MSRLLLQAVARPTLLKSAATTACPACQRRSAHKLVEIELIQDVQGLGYRGDRLPVSPGRARNVLLPLRQALLVGRNGRAVSPLRDMIKKERDLEEWEEVKGERLRRRMFKKREETVRREAEVIENEDPLVLAQEADRDLLLSLSLLSPLIFPRRPIHPVSPSSPSATPPTSKEIFGSVSVHDVVTQLKDFGINVDESQGTFKEVDGVEKGRVKALGEYEFEVSFKALEEVAQIKIHVISEA